MRRALAITLVLVVGLLVGVYLASPWLVQRAALAAADAYGVSEVVIDVDRPGLGHVLVRDVQLSAPGFRLTGTNARIAYTVSGLLQGRIATIQVQALTLVLDEVEGADAGSDEANLSPEQLFPVLPVESIDIAQLRLEVPELGFIGAGAARWAAEALSLNFGGVAPEAASQFALDATLSKAGVFDARFSESGADGGDILRAAGRLEESDLMLNGRIDLHGYALTLVSNLAGLPAGEGRLSGAFETTLPWPPVADLSWQDLSGALEDAQVNWKSAADDLALDLSVVSLTADGGSVKAVVSGTADASRENMQGRLVLPSGYALNYHDGTLRGAGGPELDVEMDGVELNASVQQFSLEPAADLPLAFAADVTAKAENLNLTGQLSGEVAPARGELAYAGEFDVQDVKQSGQLAAQYQLDGDDLAVNGELTVAQLRGAAFNLAVDLATGAGRADITNELTVEKPLAASLMPGWAEDYDVDSGVMDIMARASWRTPEKIAGQVHVALDGISAHYADYLATDLRGTLELSADNVAAANWQLAPSSLTVGTVDVGFPIEDLQMTVAGDLATLRITDTQARLLGGRARAADFDYDLGAGNARIALTLEALDLAQVLALEGEDVSGSGTLEGTLPVTIRDNAVSMQNGTVRALAPGGTIALSPSLARGTGQPGLDFALIALQDFRFSALTGDIDYAENGDMVLAVKLKGNNPAVEGGRAIEYNLNITENLPTLLESLRLQDEVQTRIERKLNQ